MSLPSKLRAAFSYLRPYQNEAVEFLIAHPGALLADAMGLGKSITAITAARFLDLKTVIVCPSYVRTVWDNPNNGELKKWWPSILEKLYKPESLSAHDIPAYAKVILIHYDIISAWAPYIAKWNPNVVIIDECHYLTNERTQRSQGVRDICKNAQYRWGLSGTPLTNRPKDIWNIIDTLHPNFLGRFFPFALKHCNAHKRSVTPTKVVWDFSGASNIPELSTKLDKIMLRRTVKDVALQLPPKTRQTIFIDTPSKSLTSELSVSAIRRMLEVASDSKLDTGYNIISEHISSGHKVVVFSHRREIAEYFVNLARGDGIDARLIHGGVSLVNRGIAIEKAKSVSNGGLLSVTIDTAGTGIDLSYADVGIFVELTYEPHKLLQAEARLHRFGQEKPVLIQYLIATGTVDELVSGIVIDKLSTFESVIGDTNETLSLDLQQSENLILEEMYAAISKMNT